MSVSELPPSIAESSLTAPPAKLTFAERFRWLGIVANGILVGAIVVFLLQFPATPFGPSALESVTQYSLTTVVAAFAVGWAIFVQWRRVRDAWAGMLVPGMLLAATLWVLAVIDPTTALAFSLDPPRIATLFVVLYVASFGLLWSWGLRLLDRKCLETSWQRGQFSLRTLMALTVAVAVYGGLVRDVATDGPLSHSIVLGQGFGWNYPSVVRHDELVFALIASHAAILAFALSMSSYAGCGVTMLASAVFYYLSLEQRNVMLFFYIYEPMHWMYFIAMILFFTAGMALPWLLIGWRIVWTPPLWDRSRRSTSPPQQ